MTKNSMIFTIMASVLAAPLFAQEGVLDDAKVVSLPDWRYDDLYSNGVSARNLFDRDVYGRTGDEIGDVEDILIGPDGQVKSIVAEVGASGTSAILMSAFRSIRLIRQMAGSPFRSQKIALATTASGTTSLSRRAQSNPRSSKAWMIGPSHARGGPPN